MIDTGVESDIKKTLLVEGLEIVDSHEPYVSFTNEVVGNYLYCARILVFVPSVIKDKFTITQPSFKKDIETDLGTINTRTIKVKWDDDIDPIALPHDLWAITVRYFPIVIDSVENVIRVIYEFGDPRTSRGTVTTSGNPS